MKKIIVAVDGFSSCGKSSIARSLAAALGYIYIDTGAMYRAATLYALAHNIFTAEGSIDEGALRSALSNIHISFEYNPSTQRSDTLLNGTNVEREIRGMEVSSRVSMIAALPFVREAMVVEQRAIGKDKGLVMDGRDIGTTVFPDAELKIFVTASEEVRAERRYKELREKNMHTDYEEVLRNIRQRDELDTNRSISPLRKADDAVILDNSAMTIEEQNRWAVEQAQRVLAALEP